MTVFLAENIEPLAANTVASVRKAKPKAEPAETPDDANTAKSVAICTGTKQVQIIAMLLRPLGATVAEIVEATGWLAQTVGGSISGALKKRLGLPITSEKVEGRGTVYRMPLCELRPDINFDRLAELRNAFLPLE